MQWCGQPQGGNLGNHVASLIVRVSQCADFCTAVAGSFLATTKAVCDAGSGGMVLLSR